MGHGWEDRSLRLLSAHDRDEEDVLSRVSCRMSHGDRHRGRCHDRRRSWRPLRPALRGLHVHQRAPARRSVPRPCSPAGTAPEGWIKAGIKGFELRALRGMADRNGIQIRNGVADIGVDMRLRPSRKAPTTIKIALSDLSIRDSSDGIIQNVFTLPVSLDAAIYMLQGFDGSIRLSVPFTLDLKTLSPKNMNARIIVIMTFDPAMGVTMPTLPFDRLL